MLSALWTAAGTVLEDIVLYNNKSFLVPLFLIALLFLWVTVRFFTCSIRVSSFTRKNPPFHDGKTDYMTKRRDGTDAFPVSKPTFTP